MKLLEGSRVKFLIENDKLILIPENGQGSVTVCKEVCETSRSGSIPDSGPMSDNMSEYNPQNEINIALKKLLTGVISKKQYDRIAQIYKPIQD